MEIVVVQLCDLLNEFGEESVKQDFLANFSCPMNKDVEYFLKRKAILYERMDKSRSYIVISVSGDIMRILGYFSLTSREIQFEENISNRTRKKILGTGFEANSKISAILIGQFSKNYSNNNNILITGKELFELAIHKAIQANRYIGGRIVYLECEDNPKLIKFYSNMGLDLYVNDHGIPVLSETGLLTFMKSIRNIVAVRKEHEKKPDRIVLRG